MRGVGGVIAGFVSVKLAFVAVSLTSLYGRIRGQQRRDVSK
jgi:hypothetical protein